MKGKQYTTELFVSRAKVVHGDRYDYSKSIYTGRHENLIIICKKHGEFVQQAGNHLQGRNCPECVAEETSKRLNYTTEIFIEKATKLYKDKFTYSNTHYIDSKTPVIITCCAHGDVPVVPVRFLMNAGCPKCNGIIVTDTASFVRAAMDKYGDKYDYTDAVYESAKSKIKICCPVHGVFYDTPDKFLRKAGSGCNLCDKNIQMERGAASFLKKSHEIHGNKYDYSLVKYTGINKKVDIICPVHGVFSQQVSVHLKGCGCPNCRASSGETDVRVYLEQHNIIHAQEYSFSECKDKGMLHFDFVLFSPTDYTTIIAAIEYDGEHHFKAIPMWGSSVYLEDVQRRDSIKNQFCEDNNIPLLRIPYWEKDKIPEKLDAFLKEIA